MKREKVRNILIVISILIILFGIIAGISAYNEMINDIHTGEVNIDGSDFSGIFKISGYMGARVIEVMIIVCSVFTDILIWIIYGIILLTIKLVKKIKSNKEDS